VCVAGLCVCKTGGGGLLYIGIRYLLRRLGGRLSRHTVEEEAAFSKA